MNEVQRPTAIGLDKVLISSEPSLITTLDMIAVKKLVSTAWSLASMDTDVSLASWLFSAIGHDNYDDDHSLLI